jgi:hypothetical protein
VTLRDCVVGTLDIGSRAVKDFYADNCHIISPALNGAGPHFTGNVLMSDVFVPRKEHYFRDMPDGFQQFVDLQHALLEMGNTNAAGIFQSPALSIYRKRMTGINADWLVNVLYEYSCDFGNSIARPFWLWFALVFAVGFSYWAGEGAALVGHADYSNWQAVFTRCDLWGPISRAAWLSWQSANPLGFLASNPPVVAAEWWWATLGTVHRLLSAVLLFLGFLAIRRRFRMSG